MRAPEARKWPRTMNKKEQEALYRLFCRDWPRPVHETNQANHRSGYRAFRRRAYYTMAGCWIVPDWHGMTVGIERDGYTHT
jgi:hypothetical protein